MEEDEVFVAAATDASQPPSSPMTAAAPGVTGDAVGAATPESAHRSADAPAVSFFEAAASSALDAYLRKHW